VFPGVVVDTGPGTGARSSLSFLSVAQEGKGLARCLRLRLTVSKGHEYPLVVVKEVR